MSTKFYAHGNGVYQRPEGGTMGFLVARADEYAKSDDGRTVAQVIADALNLADAIEEKEYEAETPILDQIIKQQAIENAALGAVAKAIGLEHVPGWENDQGRLFAEDDGA